MLDQSIQDLLSRSLARIESAQTPDDLEAVRVEALGRKGALAGFSKDMGKLTLEEKKREFLSTFFVEVMINQFP